MASFFGEATTVGATRTNTGITVPASAPTGAISLISFYVEGDVTPTPPSGYAEISATDHSGAAMDHFVWWKRLGASEGGTTHTVTHANTWTSAAMVVVQDASATVAPVAGVAGQGASTTPQANSVTPIGNNADIVFLVVTNNGRSATPPTGTTPTFTERVDINDNCYAADGTLATAGATGAKSTTITSDNWIAVMVVVEDTATSGEASLAGSQIVFKANSAAVGTETSGAALNPTCSDFSPSRVAGDILIAHVYWEGTVDTPSTPTGWTLLDGPRLIETSIARQWVFGTISDGTEAVVDFGSPAVTTQRAAKLYCFSGRRFGSITELVDGFAYLSNATDPAPPTVTTTVKGAMHIIVVGQNDNNTFPSTGTGTTGGTWTELIGESVFNLTPGMTIGIYRIPTPTNDPGQVTGGTIATTNDPVGTTGFQIKPYPDWLAITERPGGMRGRRQMHQLLAT